MSTCIPSPGPMWATWLKLVGLDIILDLSSGSLSISLRERKDFLRFTNMPPHSPPPRREVAGPGTARSPPLLQPLLLRHFEDKAPLAPGPEHLLPAVIGGVGHVEGCPCGNEGRPLWLRAALPQVPRGPRPAPSAARSHPRTCS